MLGSHTEQGKGTAKVISTTSSTHARSRGVIYIAIGRRFYDEACISARSLRRYMPTIPIALFTDQSVGADDLFETVTRIEQSGMRPHRVKLVWMPRSSFDETLYLDTDTYVCGEVAELFDLLDAFDIAMTHDRGYVDNFPPEENVPDAFRELNTGVVVYHNSPRVTEMFADSLACFDRFSDTEFANLNDQQPLRMAIYRSEVRIAPLTFEYNCRFPNFGYLSGRVKILHGRPPLSCYSEQTLQEIADRLNEVTIPRVFVAGKIFGLAKNAGRFARPYYASHIGNLFRSRWVYLIDRALANSKEEGTGRGVGRILQRLKAQRRG